MTLGQVTAELMEQTQHLAPPMQQSTHLSNELRSLKESIRDQKETYQIASKKWLARENITTKTLREKARVILRLEQQCHQLKAELLGYQQAVASALPQILAGQGEQLLSRSNFLPGVEESICVAHPEVETRLREIFDRADRNKDDLVSRAELITALRTDADLQEIMFEAIFAAMDTDEDHCLSFLEFTSYISTYSAEQTYSPSIVDHTSFLSLSEEYTQPTDAMVSGPRMDCKESSAEEIVALQVQLETFRDLEKKYSEQTEALACATYEVQSRAKADELQRVESQCLLDNTRTHQEQLDGLSNKLRAKVEQHVQDACVWANRENELQEQLLEKTKAVAVLVEKQTALASVVEERWTVGQHNAVRTLIDTNTEAALAEQQCNNLPLQLKEAQSKLQGARDEAEQARLAAQRGARALVEHKESSAEETGSLRAQLNEAEQKCSVQAEAQAHALASARAQVEESQRMLHASEASSEQQRQQVEKLEGIVRSKVAKHVEDLRAGAEREVALQSLADEKVAAVAGMEAQCDELHEQLRVSNQSAAAQASASEEESHAKLEEMMLERDQEVLGMKSQIADLRTSLRAGSDAFAAADGEMAQMSELMRLEMDKHSAELAMCVGREKELQTLTDEQAATISGTERQLTDPAILNPGASEKLQLLEIQLAKKERSLGVLKKLKEQATSAAKEVQSRCVLAEDKVKELQQTVELIGAERDRAVQTVRTLHVPPAFARPCQAAY